MGRKFNPFIKAIETKYDGYKFRSRLEARWATFFNALDIPYIYEDEGYNIEGTWYLPDFWMPKMNCFIEIKGEEPTEEEIKKARLLSLYKDKFVYIIYGNIALPNHKNTHRIHAEYPPTIALEISDPQTKQWDFKDISPSLEARVAMQRLDEIFMELTIEDGDLTVKNKYKDSISLDALEAHIRSTMNNLPKLSDLIPLLKKCEDELFEIFLQNEENQATVFMGQEDGSDQIEWLECPDCKKIGIWAAEVFEFGCLNCQESIPTNNTPRLIAAYEAARQARF